MTDRKRRIRHHQKSKTGCSECRERKIKCDEHKPICRNCVRRQSVCTFSGAVNCKSSRRSDPRFSISSPSSPDDDASPTILENICSSPKQPQQLIQQRTPGSSQQLQKFEPSLSLVNILQMELLLHWCKSTSNTITRSPELKILWRDEVPRIGLSHGYVLQAMLSLSAVHLSRLNPNKKDLYMAAATSLQNAAIRDAAPALLDITKENCTALFIFSGLNWIYAFAAPPKPGSLPPYGITETSVDLIIQLRGICSIVFRAWPWLLAQNLGPIVQLAASMQYPTTKISPAEKHIVHLETLISSSLHDSDKECDISTYSLVLESLRTMFLTFHNAPNHVCILPIVFAWPSGLSQEYVEMLGKREPQALAIFAFWAVLLKEAERCWWIQGWAVHFVERIWDVLDWEKRLWIWWPMEEIGWSPPSDRGKEGIE